MCTDKDESSNTEHVPDFSAVGFERGAGGVAAAHASIPDLHALKLSVCVGASYNASTNQICFSIPIYGDLCIPSPIKVPISASLKACAETCGSFIPTGVKATIYMNGSAIWSGTVVGNC